MERNCQWIFTRQQVRICFRRGDLSLFPYRGISKLESGIYSSIIHQIIGTKIQSKKTTPLVAINENPYLG
jgi:hypothetical protein